MTKKLRIIQVLFLCIFIACTVYLGIYFHSSRTAQTDYDNLKQLVKAEAGEDITDSYIPECAENGMLKAYYELYERNNDLRGWIKIPDTRIDYPVVQAEDNNFYLRRDFEKKHQNNGIPFMDYQCVQNSENTIIYAHNMKDGSMFAALIDYESRQFYEAHKRIVYDTVYDKGRYEVIAAFRTNAGSKNEFKYYEYINMDKPSFEEYIRKVKELSIYDTGITAEYGDKLLTLSTCAYRSSNERFVVVARQVRY